MMGEWVLRGGLNREEAVKVYRAKQQEKNKQNKYTALEMNYTKDGKILIDFAVGFLIMNRSRDLGKSLQEWYRPKQAGEASG